MTRFFLFCIATTIASISLAQTSASAPLLDEHGVFWKLVCANQNEGYTVTFELPDHNHLWSPEKGGKITIAQTSAQSQITDMYVTIATFGGEADMDENFQFSTTTDATNQNDGYPSARIIHRTVQNTWLAFVGLSESKIVEFDSCEPQPQ